MKRISLPDAGVEAALTACLESVRNEQLDSSLRAAAPGFLAAELAYLNAAAREGLFEIPGSDDVDGHVTTKEMEALYKGNFSRSRSPARRIYDAIKLAPPHGICPLCGQRVVATLDHYLAKSVHPRLAITPANLIPACSDCNKLKLDRQARDAQEQPLHPYFDRLPDGLWLFTEVWPTSPPTIQYVVRPPAEWPSLAAARLHHHFQLYGLADLYGAQASAELVDIAFGLLEIAAVSSMAELKSHLQQQARSRAAHDANSWKAAFYRGLAASEWFCAEGFRQIRV